MFQIYLASAFSYSCFFNFLHFLTNREKLRLGVRLPCSGRAYSKKIQQKLSWSRGRRSFVSRFPFIYSVVQHFLPAAKTPLLRKKLLRKKNIKQRIKQRKNKVLSVNSKQIQRSCCYIPLTDRHSIHLHRRKLSPLRKKNIAPHRK